MANRTFLPAKALDPSLVQLNGVFKVGLTGTVAYQDCWGFSIAQNVSGASSIPITGTYTVTFNDLYPTSEAKHLSASFSNITGAVSSPFMNMHATIRSQGGARAFLIPTVVSSSIHVDKTMQFVFDSAANTPGNVPSGSLVHLSFWLKNSSIPRS